jgi:hypothetical protein
MPPLPQTPSLALSVSPAVALPATSGAATEVGGTICTTGGAVTTAAVARDTADAVPSSLVAVTATTRVEPTSSGDAV